MAIYNYQDLEVYREAFELAVEVHQVTEDFPKHERFALVDQLRRSSKGICAMIAEGFSHKGHPAEFKRYLRMAHGSLQESKVWIEFCGALGYLEREQADRYWQRYDRLGKRLYRMHQSWT